MKGVPQMKTFTFGPNGHTVNIDGQEYKLETRSFLIPPKKLRLFLNAQGGPYKYCYWDRSKERYISQPLPFTKVTIDLVESGLL